MPLWKEKDGRLVSIPCNSIITVGGLQLSPPAAARRFSQQDILEAGYLVEIREPDLGNGFDPPRISVDDEGMPCVVIPAVQYYPGQAADTARMMIIEDAKRKQQFAASGYDWPEAAAWESLERQARSHLEDPQKEIGTDLIADCGPDASAGQIADRARAVIAKADAFREEVGAIKRWRRDALGQIDAAETAGATAAEMRAIAEAAIAGPY